MPRPADRSADLAGELAAGRRRVAVPLHHHRAAARHAALDAAARRPAPPAGTSGSGSRPSTRCAPSLDRAQHLGLIPVVPGGHPGRRGRAGHRGRPSGGRAARSTSSPTRAARRPPSPRSGRAAGRATRCCCRGRTWRRRRCRTRLSAKGYRVDAVVAYRTGRERRSARTSRPSWSPDRSAPCCSRRPARWSRCAASRSRPEPCWARSAGRPPTRCRAAGLRPAFVAERPTPRAGRCAVRRVTGRDVALSGFGPRRRPDARS